MDPQKKGKLLWSKNIGTIVDSSLAVGKNGEIYMGDLQGTMYAFNSKDGSEIWKINLMEPLRNTPIVLDDMVIVGTEDGVYV